MVEPGIGYVPLQTFNETSANEALLAMMKLRAEGAKGLILDLRGNPGDCWARRSICRASFSSRRLLIDVRYRSGAHEADSSVAIQLPPRVPEGERTKLMTAIADMRSVLLSS